MSLSKTPIRAVLFDLDDTLFDHRQSAADALRRVQDAYDPFRAIPFGAFEREHASLLEAIHPDVVSGRLGMDDARRERFRRLFERFDAAADNDACAAAAALYRRAYLETRRATAGAEALLAHLHERVRIAIVSNNLLDEQRDKLEHCGLGAHVDALIVSEAAGVSKPDPAIFAIALDALGADPAAAVMVGDSWSADVMGARAAGIAAIWFNPLRQPPPAPDPSVPELYALHPAADAARRILFVKGVSS